MFANIIYIPTYKNHEKNCEWSVYDFHDSDGCIHRNGTDASSNSNS
jgi:hypothetical protein